MKGLILTIIFSAICVAGFSKGRYLITYDSVKVVKLKAGHKYKIKTAATNEEMVFQKIENDTFYFNERNMHYSQITAIRNKKRSGVLDAVALPVTVGSCLLMSSFPILYFQGYFQADTRNMLTAVGYLLAETIAFYTARNYLATNKKWVEISSMKRLKVREV
ncbi:MAG: hypothetical protein KDC92_11855 [Bacteroidetes bacterium]|nr:hypothetical protein [Bacteroidota bacterium]